MKLAPLATVVLLFLVAPSARAQDASLVELVSQSEGVDARILRAALKAPTQRHLQKAFADAVWLADRKEPRARRAAWWSVGKRIEEAKRLGMPAVQKQAEALRRRVTSHPEVADSCLLRVLAAREALLKNDLPAFERAYAAAAKADVSDFERDRLESGLAVLKRHGLEGKTELLLPYVGGWAASIEELVEALRVNAGALAVVEFRARRGRHDQAAALFALVEAIRRRLFPSSLSLQRFAFPESLRVETRFVLKPKPSAFEVETLILSAEQGERAKRPAPIFNIVWKALVEAGKSLQDPKDPGPLAKVLDDLVGDAEDAHQRKVLSDARSALANMSADIGAINALPQRLQLRVLEGVAAEVPGPARDAIESSMNGRLSRNTDDRGKAAELRRLLESQWFYEHEADDADVLALLTRRPRVRDLPNPSERTVVARLLKMKLSQVPQDAELEFNSGYDGELLLALARAALGDRWARLAMEGLGLNNYDMALHAGFLAAAQMEDGRSLIVRWGSDPRLRSLDKGYYLGAVEGLGR